MLDDLTKIFSIIGDVFAVLTGILTLGITLWIIFIGQSQFKVTSKISEEQLQLSKLEREQIVDAGVPLLGVATNGFTPIFEKGYYNFLLKIQNYGERPAYNIKISLYSIGLQNSKYEIIDLFRETAANPIPKGVQWDLGREFTTQIKSRIYIYCWFEYRDIVTKKLINDSYLLYIPEFKYLIDKKERALMAASITEKDSIELFIKNLE